MHIYPLVRNPASFAQRALLPACANETERMHRAGHGCGFDAQVDSEGAHPSRSRIASIARWVASILSISCDGMRRWSGGTCTSHTATTSTSRTSTSPWRIRPSTARPNYPRWLHTPSVLSATCGASGGPSAHYSISAITTDLCEAMLAKWLRSPGWPLGWYVEMVFPPLGWLLG